MKFNIIWLYFIEHSLNIVWYSPNYCPVTWLISITYDQIKQLSIKSTGLGPRSWDFQALPKLTGIF